MQVAQNLGQSGGEVPECGIYQLLLNWTKMARPLYICLAQSLDTSFLKEVRLQPRPFSTAEAGPEECDSWRQSADYTLQSSKLFLEVGSGWHITTSTSFQPLVLLGSASPYKYVEQKLYDCIKHFFLIEDITKGCQWNKPQPLPMHLALVPQLILIVAILHCSFLITLALINNLFWPKWLTHWYDPEPHPQGD